MFFQAPLSSLACICQNLHEIYMRIECTIEQNFIGVVDLLLAQKTLQHVAIWWNNTDKKVAQQLFDAFAKHSSTIKIIGNVPEDFSFFPAVELFATFPLLRSLKINSLDLSNANLQHITASSNWSI